MNCKDIEIDIVEGDAFRNDKLGRKIFADNLTKIADSFSKTGAVIAIDGEWGAGKTTFVNMWKQQLLDMDYKAIYFNAWECDFQDDPFIAIMSELSNVFNKTNSEGDELISIGTRIIPRVAGEFIKGLIKNYIGFNTEVLDVAIEETAEQCKKLITDYQEQKDTIIDFRKRLSEFVASESNGNPLIFFIDELDRCNPHFAVKLLERVKHIFEVPNIIFVLSLNINQLQYAIQGFYGSSNINGREYLRRFIDIEFTLPAPNMESYSEFLYEQYGLNSYFDNNERKNDNNLAPESQIFKQITNDVLSASNLSLRQVNKLFAYMRLSLCTFSKRSHFSSSMFFILCYLKLFYSNIYTKIKDGDYSLQELFNTLINVLPDSLFKVDASTQHPIAWTIASLIVHYNMPDNRIAREDFKNEGSEDNPIFPLQISKVDINEINDGLLFYAKRKCYKTSIETILERIDLATSLQINN